MRCNYRNSSPPRPKWHFVLVAITFVLIGAVSPAPPDELIRQGNQAVESGNFNDALLLYQQAEERGTDPGLIAFNKATALYHLKDYRKAENHYRMAIDDAAIPNDRRAKALYNLGNCLVQQAGAKDHKSLRDAIRFYELCLDTEPEPGLRSDAAHNLELAKLLWNKARATISRPPDPNTDDPPEQKKQPEPKKEKEKVQPKDGSDPAKDKTGKDDKKPELDPKPKIDPKGQPDPKVEMKKIEASGPRAGPPVLPDKDQLERRSPEDTLRTLRAIEARLHNERQSQRRGAAISENSSGKDW